MTLRQLKKAEALWNHVSNTGFVAAMYSALIALGFTIAWLIDTWESFPIAAYAITAAVVVYAYRAHRKAAYYSLQATYLKESLKDDR